MSLKNYIKGKFDTVNTAILLFFVIPLTFTLFYVLSSYTNSYLIFYVGLYICGILTFFPLWLLIGFFQLMINPAKYKEYQMKKARQKKEEERRTYLLIFLNFLWNPSINVENN